MNTTTAAREATRRPTQDRAHADRVACLAARDARELNGATIVQAASVYAAVYAAAMRGER